MSANTIDSIICLTRFPAQLTNVQKNYMNIDLSNRQNNSKSINQTNNRKGQSLKHPNLGVSGLLSEVEVSLTFLHFGFELQFYQFAKLFREMRGLLVNFNIYSG